jgi:hypothetical protein
MTPRVFAMTIASLRMVTFALLGALCVLSICRAQPAGAKADAAARPNILVIVASNLRWDETGYAGHPFVRTPNLDRLAREGAQFESAFTTTPDAAASFNGVAHGTPRHGRSSAVTNRAPNAARRWLPHLLRRTLAARQPKAGTGRVRFLGEHREAIIRSAASDESRNRNSKGSCNRCADHPDAPISRAKELGAVLRRPLATGVAGRR